MAESCIPKKLLAHYSRLAARRSRARDEAGRELLEERIDDAISLALHHPAASALDLAAKIEMLAREYGSSVLDGRSLEPLLADARRIACA